MCGIKFHSFVHGRTSIANVERGLCRSPALNLQLSVIIRSLKNARNKDQAVGGKPLFQRPPPHEGTPDSIRNPLSPTKASSIPLSKNAVAWLFFPLCIHFFHPDI